MTKKTTMPAELDPEGVGYRTVFEDELDHTPLVVRIYQFGPDGPLAELRFELLDLQGITLYESSISEDGVYALDADPTSDIQAMFPGLDIVDERDKEPSAAHHFVGQVQQYARDLAGDTRDITAVEESPIDNPLEPPKPLVVISDEEREASERANAELQAQMAAHPSVSPIDPDEAAESARLNEELAAAAARRNAPVIARAEEEAEPEPKPEPQVVTMTDAELRMMLEAKSAELDPAAPEEASDTAEEDVEPVDA